MKIAFDAKRLFYNKTGLGNYSRSLVRYLKKLYPENEIVLMTPDLKDTEFPSFKNGDFKLLSGQGKLLWRFSRMTSDILNIKPDIYHGLSNELPFGASKIKEPKFVVTIHDLIFLRHPEFYSFVDRLLYREKFSRACKVADHIIAISEVTKLDIIDFFGIKPEKISVVYQSCSDIYYEDGIADLEREGYGLFVSSITRRKNLEIIIEAIKRMKPSNRPIIKIVGGGGRHLLKLRSKIKDYELDPHFEFLGHVDDLTLRRLYGAASFSIYPSLYEGFGIPIIESLLCGTPVITSNCSSMPEAASGMADLIDPYSVDEVVDKIMKLKDQRSKLPDKKVREIQEKFNPENQIEGILRVYRSIL